MFVFGITTTFYYLIESTSSASIPSSSFAWGSMKTLAPLLTGVVSLIWFCYLECKEQDEDRVVLSLQLWKSCGFSSSLLILLCLAATSSILFFYLSLTFQNVMGFSAMTSACSFIDHGIGLAIGLLILSKLSKSTTTAIIWNKVIMALGWICILSSSVLLAQITPNSTFWRAVLPGLLLHCLGLGPIWVHCQHNLQMDPTSEEDHHVGVLKDRFFQAGIQFGAPIGLAIANKVVVAATSPMDEATALTMEALMKGYCAAFYTCGVIAGIGLFLVLVFAPTFQSRQEKNASFMEMKETERVGLSDRDDDGKRQGVDEGRGGRLDKASLE